MSNKVLECLVLRFAKNKVILCEAYIIVMIRLHLAHGMKLPSGLFNTFLQTAEDVAEHVLEF